MKREPTEREKTLMKTVRELADLRYPGRTWGMSGREFLNWFNNRAGTYIQSGPIETVMLEMLEVLT